MKRLLRSTAIALFLSSIPLPVPFIYASVHAEEGSVPDWVQQSCCGPQDAHKLRAEQIYDQGDYYVVDGYHERIPKTLGGKPNDKIMPSQDGDYWIFYADNAAGWQGGMYGGHPYYENASQSFYCFFLPMAF